MKILILILLISSVLGSSTESTALTVKAPSTLSFDQQQKKYTVYYVFELLRAVLVQLELVMALAESVPSESALDLFRNLKKTKSIILNKSLLKPFCGLYWNSKYDQTKIDLINMYQRAAILPWVNQVRPISIIMPKVSKSRDFWIDIKENIDRRKVFFKILPSFKWSYRIRRSLINHIIKQIKRYIIFELEKVFLVKIDHFDSIPIFFDTNLPSKINVKNMTEVFKLYVNFPFYSFRLK